MSLKWKVAQAAEIRWWKNYLRKKPIGPYLKNKKAYWRHLLDLAGIKITEDEQILDIGCGPAGIFILLQNHTVDALDPLIDEYAKQLKHFKPKAFPNVNFIAMTLESYNTTKSYRAKNN